MFALSERSGRRDDVLRTAAHVLWEARHAEDLVSLLELRDTRSYCCDEAGHIPTENPREAIDRDAMPRTSRAVNGVDSDKMRTDQHFADAGRRLGDGREPDHLRRPIGIEDRRCRQAGRPAHFAEGMLGLSHEARIPGASDGAEESYQPRTAAPITGCSKILALRPG